MRLFIAINFDEKVKDQLEQTIHGLKKEAVRGNFTRRENMHLTVAFLGEVPQMKVQTILHCMNQAVADRKTFEIEMNELGKFVHRQEKLFWCGVQENDELRSMQKQLVQTLIENQFSVDNKPFQPHITLGRRCEMKQNFQEQRYSESIPRMVMRVTSIDLMKSERINGKLVYTKIGEAGLQ